MEEAEHRARFAIFESGCIRYAVRTNNWAESQNNAMEKVRSGPLLDVLINALRYTSLKVSAYRQAARKYQESGTNGFTNFGMIIFNSNFKFAMTCVVEERSSTEWRVREFNMIFIVKQSHQGAMSCSCHRFFDEGIPCQHIIKVFDFAGIPIRPVSLISPIYAINRFVQAFPDKLSFSPKESDFFLSNPCVSLPCYVTKIGAPQKRRIASTGEFAVGNTHTHHVSHRRNSFEHESSSTDGSEQFQDDTRDEKNKIDLDRALACRMDFSGDCFSAAMKFVTQQREDDPAMSSEPSSTSTDREESESQNSLMTRGHESAQNQDRESVVPDKDVPSRKEDGPTQIIIEDDSTAATVADDPAQANEQDCPTQIIIEDDSTAANIADDPTHMIAEDDSTAATIAYDPAQAIMEDDPTQGTLAVPELPRSKVVVRGPNFILRKNSLRSATTFKSAKR